MASECLFSKTSTSAWLRVLNAHERIRARGVKFVVSFGNSGLETLESGMLGLRFRGLGFGI